MVDSSLPRSELGCPEQPGEEAQTEVPCSRSLPEQVTIGLCPGKCSDCLTRDACSRLGREQRCSVAVPSLHFGRSKVRKAHRQDPYPLEAPKRGLALAQHALKASRAFFQCRSASLWSCGACSSVVIRGGRTVTSPVTGSVVWTTLEPCRKLQLLAQARFSGERQLGRPYPYREFPPRNTDDGLDARAAPALRPGDRACQCAATRSSVWPPRST